MPVLTSSGSSISWSYIYRGKGKYEEQFVIVQMKKMIQIIPFQLYFICLKSHNDLEVFLLKHSQKLVAKKKILQRCGMHKSNTENKDLNR